MIFMIEDFRQVFVLLLWENQESGVRETSPAKEENT